MRRRPLMLGALATLVAPGLGVRAARGEQGKGWSLEEITLPGTRDIGQRMALLTPTHTKEEVPLLVLLHGLGETHDQTIGARAWADRYGLLSSYERLLSPPVARENEKYRYWTDALLDEANRQLTARPFAGLAIACPFTPNVYKAKRGRQATLDLYADWVADTVIPRARQHPRVRADRCYLDGCSLGGYVGAEVFLRRPKAFHAWGTLQGALGAHRVAGYAERIAELFAKDGARPVHVETSTGDTFRKVNERFSAELKRHGVAHELIAPPGPHNQPFLRDSGTLLKLLWYDRLPR